MTEPAPIEVHKALADDTRYRLYRYLRLSGRPVPVRELSTRLSLHANTLRPHLRRLEEAGLVASETRRGPSAVGRPQTVYTAWPTNERDGRDYRLLADILASLITGTRARRGPGARPRVGGYLVTRHAPPPGGAPSGAEPRGAPGSAGRGRVRPPLPPEGTRTVEISLRDCPFRDLLDEHRELVCAVHRGLLEGMLGGSRPPLRLRSFEPLADRSSVCRVAARRLSRGTSPPPGLKFALRGRWEKRYRAMVASCRRPPLETRCGAVENSDSAVVRSSTAGSRSSWRGRAPTCTSRSARRR